MNKNKHVIDMIFPIALFFVFISSCFIVLILSFHTYRKTVQLEQSNYQTRTGSILYYSKNTIKMI